MFALHGLLDQRLKKFFLLCLVFSCLSSINPQWAGAVAPDQPYKKGGLKGFMERLLGVQSTSSTPTTSTSTSSLTFTAAQGSANPAAQTVSITNTGGGTLSWTASDPATWLSLNPTSGAITAGQSNVITVSVNTAGLTASTYPSTITINASGATNPTQQVLVTLAITSPSSGTATLTWDPETDPSVKGYKVYAGTSSNAFGAPVDVGNVTTFQIINLQSGATYYFTVTAYNSAGESGYSNVVSKSIP